MLDIGGGELLVIGVAALIFIGPKDLPRMFHALGKMAAKARSMAREFQRAMDDAAKASGMEEVKRDLNTLRSVTSPGSLGINALEDAARKFENWDPKTVMRPGVAAATTTAAATTAATAAAAPASALAGAGPETQALAEKRAAEAAAARARAHELQAKAAESITKTFAERAKADAARGAGEAAKTEPAAEPVAAPKRARKAKAEVASPATRADSIEASSEDSAGGTPPARKPPVRRKKSDA